MIIAFFLLFIFPYVHGKNNHMVIVMIAGPKKIPMILYTAEYLINSYQYDHVNVEIDGVFLTKGCYGCDFPLLKDVENLFKEAKIPIHLLETNKYETIEKYQDGSWVNELYAAWGVHSSFHPAWYLTKANRINSYFNHSLTAALEKHPNTEYVLYLEDDVAFYKDSFQKLAKVLNNYDDGREGSSSTQIGCHRCNFKEEIIKECFWGYFAKLFNRQELYTFIKLQKYAKYNLCGDAVECDWLIGTGIGKRLFHFIYHFGRDKTIDRRDPRFFDSVRK